MTADALKGDREKCLEAGMDDYIAKPVRVDALRQALEKAGTCRLTDQDSALLPAVDLATFSRLRAEMDNQVDVLRDLLAVFLEETPEQIKQAREGLASGDAEVVGRAAHTVKGSCRDLGAGRLADVSAELEEAARENRLEDAQPMIEAIAAEYQRVAEEVAKISDSLR